MFNMGCPADIVMKNHSQKCIFIHSFSTLFCGFQTALGYSGWNPFNSSTFVLFVQVSAVIHSIFLTSGTKKNDYEKYPTSPGGISCTSSTVTVSSEENVKEIQTEVDRIINATP